MKMNMRISPRTAIKVGLGAIIATGGGMLVQQHRTGGSEWQWAVEAGRRLDQALDASLAATLAGLALAAAAFLLRDFNEALLNLGQARYARNKGLQRSAMANADAIAIGTDKLINSFYCFILFLANSLAIDPIATIGEVWNGMAIADTGVSVLSLSAGVGLMLQGAFAIQSTFPKPYKTNRGNDSTN